MNSLPEHVYLCIVEWPDGTQGLLFPRPGNVAIADTLEKGMADFAIAEKHLVEFMDTHIVDRQQEFAGTSIRLVKFRTLEVIQEHVHRA